MPSHKKLGIFFVVLPPILFVLAIVGHAISSFIFSAHFATEPPTGLLAADDAWLTASRTVRAAFGLFGLVGVIGFFTLEPLGIYLIYKKTPTTAGNENQNPPLTPPAANP
jgi:hypothetical protein